MSFKPIRFTEDRTGRNPNNLINNELHVLDNREVRLLIPHHKPFYVDSLVVLEEATGRVLERETDYLIYNNQYIPQMLSGKEVATIIAIKNRNVTSRVILSYQTFGGDFAMSGSVIEDLIKRLINDNRPVKWGNILSKPTGFPPLDHMHDVGDVYGFEYIVDAIYRLRDAVLVGDDYAHQMMYDYFDSILANLAGNFQDILDKFKKHIQDKNNPHEVTAEQVNAYTKEATKNMIKEVHDALEEFMNKRDNPHEVTAEQVNTYTKEQIDELLKGIETTINNKIDEFKNKIMNEDGLLKESCIPISKDPRNTIVFHNQETHQNYGLYSGPSKNVQKIYIDGLIGLDELPSEDAPDRGSLANPLRTIRYALMHYYRGGEAIIHLKEGHEYPISANKPIELPPSCHITFQPYGIETNRKMSDGRWVSDNQIHNQSANIVIVDGLKNNRNEYELSVFKTTGYNTIRFYGLNLARRLPTEVMNGVDIKPKDTSVFKQTLGNLNLSFINCRMDLGQPSRHLDQAFPISFIDVQGMSANTDITLFNTLGKLTGDNKILNSTVKSKASITIIDDEMDIDLIRSKMETFIEDTRLNETGQWLNFISNIEPKIKDPFGFVKRDGRIYIQMLENGIKNEYQIFPPLWVEEGEDLLSE